MLDIFLGVATEEIGLQVFYGLMRQCHVFLASVDNSTCHRDSFGAVWRLGASSAIDRNNRIGRR